MGSKELLAQRMEYWCNEGNLGYDQDQRWNIWEGGETDCSALALWCAWEAGYLPEKPTWGYSGSIASQLMPYGFYKVPFNFDEVRRGDILVNESHHVAIALGNGLLGQAGHDENWRYHGGQSGDQTGDETVIKPMYDYPWDFILRPPDSDEEQEQEKREKVQYVYNGGGDVYRVYNANSGMHHYTLSEAERDALVAAGWKDEGVAWRAPKSAEIAVYRMYNPNNGDHYYSQSFNECARLQDSGWIYEGVPWFSKPDGDSVYCLYNPNSGEHFYTASQSERDSLASQGWRDQGEYFRF